ncbi:extracellular calcium-sensing receptor-like [Protopterus annectens]|uniref:extracellular calcium-sensing receptor-like n=1 Tax=Protopterus annectens TaxID=7888 RepID=UPI001CF99249|nr:extracellular calcium-sensing receptor-like [Protopterus annectens]
MFSRKQSVSTDSRGTFSWYRRQQSVSISLETANFQEPKNKLFIVVSLESTEDENEKAKAEMVNHATTLPLTSDKSQGPSFLSILASFKFQSIGIARLLIHFGWTWVGFIASDNDYGLEGIQNFKNEFLKAGGCIAFSEIIPAQNYEKKMNQAAEMIKASTASVVVLYLTTEKMNPLMETIYLHGISGKVWIVTCPWPSGEDFNNQHIRIVANGTIGFSIHAGPIDGFKEFLLSIQPSKSPDDIFIKEFWEQAFGCRWPENAIGERKENRTTNTPPFCTGSERLETINSSIYDVYNFRYSYNVYNILYSLAYGLHDLLSCKSAEGPFSNGSCPKVPYFHPWQLFHYVRNVRFRNKAGDLIFFDENRESRARYDIINWQTFPDGSLRTPLVGGYDSWALDGHELTINSNIIMWNTENKQVPRSVCSESCSPGYRKATRRGEPLCCFDCVPCAKGEISNHTDCSECFHCPEYYWPNDRKDNCIPKPFEFLSYVEPLGVSLCTSTIITCLLCSCILCIFIMNRNTPIVKANNRYLSYVLLLGLMFCSLCSFIFIGYPMKLTCMLRQSLFGVIFSISVSCILAKTITVVIAFNATNPASKLHNWVGYEIPNSVIIVGSSVQFLICTAWLISCTPFPNLNMESEEGKIIVECNECSVVAFWCMLGYLGFLATVSFFVAFLSRKLPDSFNEAKYITFTMLMFVSVWLSFVPAYLSTGGKYMVAVEVFAIISSTAAMLGCIFFPKCYIILLRPELNSREYLVGKAGISSKAQ